jgi:hypothetical protein
MQRAAGPGKWRKAEGGRPRRALGPLSLVALAAVLGSLLAGCAGENRIPNDPLVGEDPPEKAAPPVKLASAGETPPARGGPVPPLPPASSGVSLASMAENKPLPGGQELRIGETPGKLVKQSWSRPGQPLEEKPNDVALQPPEQVTPVSRTGADQGVKVFDDTGAGAATYEQLVSQLKERGVDWYRLEKGSKGVNFTCTIPNPQNPAKIRTLEGTAGTDTGAIKAVLEQIDKGP